MKKSLIALSLTAFLALGTVSTVFSQSTVTTEQSDKGKKCKKKKKKKCCKKGSKECSKEKEATK
jgi:hypothetical protein